MLRRAMVATSSVPVLAAPPAHAGVVWMDWMGFEKAF